jgi:alpha-galactosidase
MGRLEGNKHLSNGRLNYSLTEMPGLTAISLCRGSNASWIRDEDSPDFIITVNGKEIDSRKLRLVSTKELSEGKQTQHLIFTLMEDSECIVVESHIVLYEDSLVLEKWLKIEYTGDQSVEINSMFPLAIHIPKASYELMYYKSAWGAEYDPVLIPLTEDLVLQTQTGRSSNGMFPWCTLFREDGELMSLAVMWSGNWKLSFQEKADREFAVLGGLSDWEFSNNLKSGESIESIHLAAAFGGNNDLNETSIQFARVGRRFWYPRNANSQSLPVEWNHWWPYEDLEINEHVFRNNVDVAANMGIEVCTLDAGWFGPSDSSAHWFNYRGDWELVNTDRFPSGIRALSDYVHRKGMKFGLWCEIEALGNKAALNERHPDFSAYRNEDSLGYVCMGNPAVQEWAYQMLDTLIASYNCDWIKLDFNLDPKAGCNRTDHGHQHGNGLYAHYTGYYNVLDRIREKHPEVILENCASGGLRTDLGILCHTHNTFLSDTDWPEHDLQIFWGASTMLAPDVCLHWGWSEWMTQEQGGHTHQSFNPRDPLLQQYQLDYYTLNGMLGGFGFSHKLPELPDWVRHRYTQLIDIYKNHVRPVVLKADVYRLTEQPQREGLGSRWAAFQYVLPLRDKHLVFIFRLHGAEPERTIYLRELDPDKTYILTWLLDNHRVEVKSGAECMSEGLSLGHLREEESALISIQLVTEDVER